MEKTDVKEYRGLRQYKKKPALDFDPDHRLVNNVKPRQMMFLLEQVCPEAPKESRIFAKNFLQFLYTQLVIMHNSP